MSHADDGTLHAYLDGELTALELAGFEGHLTSCPACRARLEEERDLLERAQSLLARAVPPATAMPPLRAGGGGPTRPLPRWVPLAWAATVLLALGGGWLARGGARTGGDARTPTEPTMVALEELDRLQSAPSADPGGEPAAPVPTPATAPAAGRVLGNRAAAGGQEIAEHAKVESEIRDEPARVAARPSSDAVADRTTAPDTAPRVGEASIALRGDAVTAAAPRAAAPAAPPIVVDGTAASVYAAAAWSPVSLDSARALLHSDPVAIAELPVQSVRASAAGVVVIEQPLSSTFTIRLFQHRAQSADLRARPRAQARELAQANRSAATELLARYVGPLRVEIAGPLPTDSLSRLLEMVRPIR